MRQLPPHDQEPSECHDLTSQETKEMQLFVKQYREKALGGGNILENGKVKVKIAFTIYVFDDLHQLYYLTFSVA